MPRDPVLEEALQTRLMVKRIAAACGIRTQAVSKWSRVPERHVGIVARLTGLRPCQLRPDLYDCRHHPVAAE